jgi:hypothetical protein
MLFCQFRFNKAVEDLEQISSIFFVNYVELSKFK